MHGITRQYPDVSVSSSLVLTGNLQPLQRAFADQDPHDAGGITPSAFASVLKQVCPSCVGSARDLEVLTLRFQTGYMVQYRDLLDYIATGEGLAPQGPLLPLFYPSLTPL